MNPNKLSRTYQMKVGVILSYLSILISVPIGLLVTPFILKRIGQSQYGLLSLIGSSVGILTVMDLGIGSTITRYVAKYRAENDKKGEENFLSICRIIYTIITLILLFLGAVFYFNLGNIYRNLTVEEYHLAQIMCVILVLNVIINIYINFIAAIISAYEVFTFTRLVNIIRILLRPVMLIIILYVKSNIIAIVVLDTVLNFLVALSFTFFTFSKLKVKIKKSKYESALFYEIAGFSFFVFLSLIVNQFYWQSGQLILGMVSSLKEVAVFAIGMQFVTYYLQFSTSISGVVLPRLTMMVTKNASSIELTSFMVKAGRIQLLILLYFLLAFIFLGKQFIFLWLGAEYYESWLVGVIILIPLTIPLFQNVGITILQAKNMHATRSIMLLVIAIINSGISYIYAKLYGAIGASIGTAISLILGNIIFINFYYHFRAGINIPVFFRDSLKGILPASLFIIVFGRFIMSLEVHSWIKFIISGVLYSLIYFLFMWFMALNNEEKSFISKPVLRNIKGLYGKMICYLGSK